jgi:hypothetical protein
LLRDAGTYGHDSIEETWHLSLGGLDQHQRFLDGGGIYIYIIFFRLAVSFALRKEEDKKDKAIGPVGKVVNEVISYRSLAE